MFAVVDCSNWVFVFAFFGSIFALLVESSKMEDDQELMKFVCKLCYKRYPSGKSLGGHMRSHVVASSAESDEKFDPSMRKLSSFGENNTINDPKIGEFGNGQSSYGLRENPRKTWRAVDSTFPLPQERFCKQCGKGFHSLKALCGHMACHSEKDRGSLKDDQSWLLDSHSDTEAEDRVIRTRSSKMKKLKKMVIKSPFCLDDGNSNGDSFVSEIDGEEQEEVAMCLMLLSRDSGNKGGVSLVLECSDNNSVVLEGKSSSIDMKCGKMDAHKSVGEKVKENGDVKVEAGVFLAEMANSDSGYFLDESAKAESEVSVDGFRERLNRIKSYRGERGKELMKQNDEYDDGGGLARIESRKRRYISEDSKRKDDCNAPEKRSKYECFNCKRTFKSYQALGGHRPCHKKSNPFLESRYESGENSLDDSTGFTAKGKRKSSSKSPSEKKISAKNKGHVCPYCSRVFKNGQALGGHKRSHFIGGHHDNLGRVAKPDLLDLNLPAPEEDGDEQFPSW